MPPTARPALLVVWTMSSIRETTDKNSVPVTTSNSRGANGSSRGLKAYIEAKQEKHMYGGWTAGQECVMGCVMRKNSGEGKLELKNTVGVDSEGRAIWSSRRL